MITILGAIYKMYDLYNLLTSEISVVYLVTISDDDKIKDGLK